MMKGLEHLSCEERLREMGLEKRRPGGISSMYINTCREGAKRTEPGSARWCPGTDQRQWAQTETQDIPTEHQETLFY